MEGLRRFIEELEKEGDLIHITDEVDPKFEISGILKKLDKIEGPAVIFDRPKGYTIPVVGNVMGSRQRLAKAMGVKCEELLVEYLKRRQNPIPPKLVSEMPQRKVVDGDDVDIPGLLPVVTYSERDSNPYITGGVVIAKSPDGTYQTMGLHRLQVIGRNRMTILLLSPPITQYFHQMEKENKAMPIAIALGVDPVFMFASVAWMPKGTKFDLAGALRDEPIKLFKCETVDIDVPVDAEIVMEGKILPHTREQDGPFGETSGYYIPHRSPVVEVQRITMRDNPLYQAVHPWGNEAFVLLVSWEAEMYAKLKSTFPEVQQLCLQLDTVGAHAVISVKKESKERARQIMLSFLLDNDYVKRVVVVDDDVDAYDLREVEWALATRFQPDRDLVVIPRLKGSALDPSTGDSHITAKMGMDATKPEDQKERFVKIDVPEEVKIKIDQILNKALQKD